mmetsp:Transcript_6232/g.26114  ORF Transcript_6232/g.26114 Transcript_6232/m.26114 type:complete len:244 (-) Transcript_6232:1729-2460(-)
MAVASRNVPVRGGLRRHVRGVPLRGPTSKPPPGGWWWWYVQRSSSRTRASRDGDDESSVRRHTRRRPSDEHALCDVVVQESPRVRRRADVRRRERGGVRRHVPKAARRDGRGRDGGAGRRRARDRPRRDRVPHKRRDALGRAARTRRVSVGVALARGGLVSGVALPAHGGLAQDDQRARRRAPLRRDPLRLAVGLGLLRDHRAPAASRGRRAHRPRRPRRARDAVLGLVQKTTTKTTACWGGL